MNTNDPASLQNLNDIVMPASVAWWPLATGWYVLATLSLVVLTWFIYTGVRNWKTNRYRRTALQELQSLSIGINTPTKRDACLRTLPALLKRTALCAYPRDKVASLSGQDWFQFLNSKVKEPSFTEEDFNTLELIAYSTGGLNAIDDRLASALISSSENWLTRHFVGITLKQEGTA